MKYLVMIKEGKLGKVSPDMYSDIWVVKEGEDDKYVEAINKFQDDLIEGGRKA